MAPPKETRDRIVKNPFLERFLDPKLSSTHSGPQRTTDHSEITLSIIYTQNRLRKRRNDEVSVDI